MPFASQIMSKRMWRDQGALAPSMQNRGGTNLVLWRCHDGHAGEGARLTRLNPDRTLA